MSPHVTATRLWPAIAFTTIAIGIALFQAPTTVPRWTLTDTLTAAIGVTAPAAALIAVGGGLTGASAVGPASVRLFVFATVYLSVARWVFAHLHGCRAQIADEDLSTRDTRPAAVTG